MLDHVAPPIYQEVEKSQEGDLNCKEAGPKAHVLGGSLMVRAEARVDVCDAGGANCDAEKPMEEEPQAPSLDTSFWSEETDDWLKPHESIQCQSYSLVAVTEGVLEVHQGQSRAPSSKKYSCDLRNDMAIEEHSVASAAFRFARHPDQQYPYRHQETERRPVEQCV